MLIPLGDALKQMAILEARIKGCRAMERVLREQAARMPWEAEKADLLKRADLTKQRRLRYAAQYKERFQ